MIEPPLISYSSPTDAVGSRIEVNLSRGESIGIFGASGVGKTTLVQAIARACLAGRAGTRIAYLPQNPRDLFPLHLATEFIVDAFAREQCDATAYRTRCRVLLEHFKLDPDRIYRVSATSLSGGEVQRVAAAILLAAEPDTLLADEPSASLDACGKAAFAEILASLRERHGLAVLIASHDIGFIRNACDRILLLADGRLMEQAPDQPVGTAVITNPATPTRPLIDITIAEHRLGVSRIVKRRPLLQDIRQSLNGGLVYGLSGPSGVGKSTLLRIIAGHERPTRGCVTRLRDVESLPFVILTPQDARQFFDPLRSMESYAQLVAARIGRCLMRTALADTLASLELPDPGILNRRAHEVSGGEAQRLVLAITLWLEPRLMCFDEIDTGVPTALKTQIGRLIRQQVMGSGKAAVLVSHDLAFLSSTCDQVINLAP